MTLRDAAILVGLIVFSIGAVLALGWYGLMAVGAAIVLIAVFTLEV